MLDGIESGAYDHRHFEWKENKRKSGKSLKLTKAKRRQLVAAFNDWIVNESEYKGDCTSIKTHIYRQAELLVKFIKES